MATTAANDPAEITVFLERVLDDGGMSNVEPAVREQMLNDLHARFRNALFASVITKLPEQDLPAFDALVQEHAPDERVQVFLRERIPNLDEYIAQAMLDFRKLYVKE